MRDKEYDRFGPWVLEITEDDPVPPLFAPHVDPEAKPILSFKIPRQIERRRANPGMNLYDYLVTLDDNDIEILQRKDNQVEAFRFPYTELRALRLTDELLRGTATLILADRTFEFIYNTVSEEIIRRMAVLLRERFGGPSATTVDVYDSGLDATSLGQHFSRLLTMEQRREPDHRPLAGQGQVRVAADDNALRRFWYGVLDKRVFESIHFCDGREVKIVGRSRVYRFRWQSAYEVVTSYIPLSAIDRVTLVADTAQPDVSLLTVTIGATDVVCGAERDNPTVQRYVEFLQGAVAQ